MFEFIGEYIGPLFGMKPQSPEEAVKIAKVASVRIEERMANVKAALEKGGYKWLPSDTLQRLHEDINKILEFVEEALTILSKAPKLDGLDATLRQLRNVRTRVDSELRKRLVDLQKEAA
jgi:hypothetical protein